MAVKNFQLHLERIIGQISFRPNLSSLQGGPTVLKDLEKDFDDWKAEGNITTLFTTSKREFLQVGPDSITAGKEAETAQTDKLVNYVEQVFQNGLEAFKLKDLRRIGFRTTQVMSSPYDFGELVELLYKKFYGSRDKLTKLSAQSVRDVVLVLVGEANGFLNRVQIGPTGADESIQNFKPNFPLNRPKLGPSNLFIDVDVFITDGLNTENASELFEGAIKENRRIVAEYIEFIGSTK